MSVDIALQKLENSGRPLRVGMVGAGATGRAIALQLATPVPGMRLVAIANRTGVYSAETLRDLSKISEINQKIFRRVPPAADQFTHLHLLAADAEPDQQKEDQLQDESAGV